MNFKNGSLIISLVTVFSLSAFSQNFLQTAAPTCLSHGKELQINNDTVLTWKNTSKNQYRDRAHVQGTLTKVFADASGHHHYQVQIGAQANDTIEFIYNEKFGIVPNASLGAKMEACGDYITANAPVGHYPASPDGAIVHWIHKSPNPQAHDSGFMMINGILCGQK